MHSPLDCNAQCIRTKDLLKRMNFIYLNSVFLDSTQTCESFPKIPTVFCLLWSPACHHTTTIECFSHIALWSAR